MGTTTNDYWTYFVFVDISLDDDGINFRLQLAASDLRFSTASLYISVENYGLQSSSMPRECFTSTLHLRNGLNLFCVCLSCLFTVGFRVITPKRIMWSTSNLVCGLPIRQERTLLVLGHISQSKISQLLEIEVSFPQHNSKINIMQSTPKLICGIRKGRTLYILGHVGQGKQSRFLKIDILFLEHNSRIDHAIIFKLGMWPAHKKRKNAFDFGSVPKVTVIKNRNSISRTYFKKESGDKCKILSILSIIFHLFTNTNNQSSAWIDIFHYKWHHDDF